LVLRKCYDRQRQTSPRYRRCQREVLLDDMSALGLHLASVKKAGRVLPRLGEAVDRRRSRPPCHQRGTNRALIINRDLIVLGAQIDHSVRAAMVKTAADSGGSG